MSSHFQGKQVVEHLREARTRGALASAEIHGVEMPGHLGAGADAAKEIAVGLAILWCLFPQSWLILVLFSIGWVIWKTARSAILGWARIERLHRVIEQERWEIEHHRQQEKEELTEMYMAKGLSGRLLEEVIEVMMADDNRLLRIMLEEELGLTLEVYEHPLKQAFGAFVGALASSIFILLGYWLFPAFGLPLFAAIAISVSAVISAKLERNRSWNAVVWNLASFSLVFGVVYFLIPLLSKKT